MKSLWSERNQGPSQTTIQLVIDWIETQHQFLTLTRPTCSWCLCHSVVCFCHCIDDDNDSHQNGPVKIQFNSCISIYIWIDQHNSMLNINMLNVKLNSEVLALQFNIL